jgi:hypothetical protein
MLLLYELAHDPLPAAHAKLEKLLKLVFSLLICNDMDAAAAAVI